MGNKYLWYMRRTLYKNDGKWEWLENPILDSDMKDNIVNESTNMKLSEFNINDMINKGATPVNNQIEKFLKEYGL